MMFGLEPGLEDQEWCREVVMNELARQVRELRNHINFLERENLRLEKQAQGLRSENAQLLREISIMSRKDMQACLAEREAL